MAAHRSVDDEIGKSKISVSLLAAKSHEYFMGEALKEARKALDLGEVPVGAVVVCQDKIIARAHNQTEQLTDATAHAEMLAVTTASYALGSKYLNECTLYVTLEPCVMCAGALHWVQLQKLVFGAEDVQRGYSLVRIMRVSPVSGSNSTVACWMA